jgi:hypothetical protein
MRAKERTTVRYADLKIALSNEGWDCSLYLIEVGARGHITFGHYSGLGSLQAVAREGVTGVTKSRGPGAHGLGRL